MARFDRAAYTASLPIFRATSSSEILGHLATAQSGDLIPAQREAWLHQIKVLKSCTREIVEGVLFFEYCIPRMGKRADNVLLINNAVVNLANDGVSETVLANDANLRDALTVAATVNRGKKLSPQDWQRSGYSPTPTIIEASQALYGGHDVKEITRFEAGADNLGSTTLALNKIIDNARSTGEKAICLVTGVPGAGKTLAGLNLANERRRIDTTNIEHAVFLSGNGPLVKVLREALSRDEVARSRACGQRVSKKDAERKAGAFIQNIHHFRDECLQNSDPPTERVVVFDEAQRAWDLDQTTKFMRQKRGFRDFDLSEPAFLIGAMNRHEGWAVVVCLVGGGQEINSGEAGMEEWLRALRIHYPNWKVFLPDKTLSEEYLPTMQIADLGDRVHYLSGLHLGVSIRSFRSELLSEGIGALLSGQREVARPALSNVNRTFPILITRSLDDARSWVRKTARGTERFGLLTSSGARRLKPLGITTSGVRGNECNWFLNDDQDVRSSYYLEDAASEFEVQGLELDWTIVVWDGDLIHDGNSGWFFKSFKGTKWQNINKNEDKQYRLNAYRVLLTRARQGMVIVIPEGCCQDHTRIPEFYDPTWNYLEDLSLDRLARQ